jgi:flagellar basal body-associated protein FliL
LVTSNLELATRNSKLRNMPGAGRAEIYFIAAMMVLILVVCTVAVIFFFKTYRKEMREKAEREAEKAAASREG